MLVDNFNSQIILDALKNNESNVRNYFPSAEKWINGEKQPTLKQLADFAKKINIPFGFLLVKNPPELISSVPLFRTNKNLPIYNYSSELRDTIYYIQKRQEWLQDYLKNTGYDHLPFAGKYKNVKDSEILANKIKEELGLEKNWSKYLNSKDESLNYLIEKIEKTGVYVTINGVVENNTHRSLSLKEFRGFALYNNYAPYIFINGKDFAGGRLFTLIHELVHIFLGISAISESDRLEPSSNEIEKFCDETTAEFLVPKIELLEFWKMYKDSTNPIKSLEKVFKVSQIVVARRLLDNDLISKEFYFNFYKNYSAQFKDKDSKSGNFYNTQNTRIGKSFFNKILKATSEGKLLYSDAFKLTSLNASTFENYKIKFN